MSAIVIISIEGVLTKVGAYLPGCDPNLAGIRLVRALSSEWAIGYTTMTTDEASATAWLREIGAPTGTFIIVSTPLNRGEAILHELGARQDRASLFVAGSLEGFDTLNGNGVSTLLYRHESFVLGDWHRESSWQNPEEHNDNDPFLGSGGRRTP